jgi:hypothetical protein
MRYEEIEESIAIIIKTSIKIDKNQIELASVISGEITSRINKISSFNHV